MNLGMQSVVCRARSAACGLAATVCLSGSLSAQEIQGRVVDAENGVGVGLAAIILLDSEREPLLVRGADIAGNYTIATPGPGEFYLVVERLGYFENETPLFAVEAGGQYGIDIEMRPEPFRLDPLEVTVDNERLENHLTLMFGQHPASLPGYRSIQGVRLEEAKMKAVDNTDLLRWLYIPVSHGPQVCIGMMAGASLPARMGYERVNAVADAANAQVDPGDQCGALYVDDIRCRNEHIEEIVADRIGVIVTLRGSVHMYTREYEWGARPGWGSAC